jgi:CRISPR-associated protein Csm3
MTQQIRLLGHLTITGEIEALSGLHVGGTADSIDKGGIDHPVIKNPVTNVPYIPGSSLRGRLRSLLERKNGRPLNEMATGIWMEIYSKKDFPADSYARAKASEVCRMFGNAQSDPGLPSILIVRDAHYTSKTSREGEFMQGGLAVTEAKMEIAVDRITAQALPRTIERIPAGARFDFAIIYKVQTNDKCEFDSNADNAVLQQDLKNILWALEEIETHDGIGGNTSRGHGQVKFHLRTLTVKNFVGLASDGCPQKPGNLDTEKDYSFDAFQTAVSEIAFSLSESNSIT